MNDITPYTDLADSTPEEAAKHIEGGKALDLGADVFKEYKQDLQPQVDNLSRPTQASPAVERNIAQSPEHASLYMDDINKLSFVEKQLKFMKDKWNGVNDENELIDRTWDKMNAKGVIDPDQEENLQILNADRLDRAHNDQFIGNWEEIPSLVGATVNDFGKYIGRNAPTIATLTAAGAGVGAVAGSVVPGMGTAAGALTLGAQAGVAAIGATAVTDSFRQQSALMYNELSYAKHADGTPLDMDHETKASIAQGIGIVSSVVTLGTGAVVAKTLPWAAKYINPGEFVKRVVLNPNSAALVSALKVISKNATIGGVAGGTTEVAKIVAEEMGKGEGTSEAGFLNAIYRTAQNMNQNLNRVGEAAKGSAISTGLITAAGQAAGYGVNRGRYVSPGERDVTPPSDAKGLPIGPDKPLLPGSGTAKGPLWHEDAIVPRKSDITPTRPGGVAASEKLGPYTPHEQAIDVLHAQDVLDHVSDETKNSKAYKLSPGEVQQLRKDMLEENGINDIWMDPEDLRKHATDEAKGKILRDMIDPTGVTSAEMNAPIRVDAHAALEFRDLNPEISDIFKLSPEGPSPESARVFEANLKAHEAKKQEILAKLGDLESRKVKLNEDKTFNVKSLSDIPAKTLNIKGEDVTLKVLNYIEPGGTESDLTKDVKVQALNSKGEEIGEMIATAYKSGKVKVEGLRVSEAYRRNGIATQMYDLYNDNFSDQLYFEENAPGRTRDGEMFRVNYEKNKKPSEQAALTEALNTLQPENNIHSEDDYVNQPTFTDAIRGALPEKEVENFDKKIRQAKQEIIDGINESAQLEMDRVKLELIDQAVETEFQVQRDALKDDPNLAIVDKFTDYERVPRASREPFPTERYPKGTKVLDLTAAHAKKGYSPFAIDPRLLPEDLKHYLEDPILKVSKVFVKGGVSPEDSARMVGMGSAKSLLKLLSTTPPRKKIVAGKVNEKRPIIQYLVDETTGLNTAAISNAYHDKVANDLAVMQYMKDQEWTTTKGTVVRLALPLPKIEELLLKAENTVNQIPIKNLNANAFKVGAKKSLRLAVSAWKKGDFETMYVNKGAEALNTAMVREAEIKTAKVNKALKNFNKLKDRKVRAVFKEAGGVLEKAFDEIMGTFNLDKSKAATAEQGSYNKYVQKMIKQGEGDFSIPDRLSDPKASVQDLTVEQVLILENRLISLFHQARKKNRLYRAKVKADQKATVDGIAKELHDIAIIHPSYKKGRGDSSLAAPVFSEKIDHVMNNLSVLITNMEHTMTRINGEVVGGPWVQQTVGRLKGTGEFAGQGLEWKGETMGKTLEKLKSLINTNMPRSGKIDKYLVSSEVGREVTRSFAEMGVKDLFIPEFKDIRVLGNGNVRQSDLFVMALSMGNETSKEALTNYGLDIETIQAVLDRELTPGHVNIVQGIHDMFDDLYPLVEALEIEHNGVAPEKLTAVPWTHQGRTLRGGYFPNIYAKDSDSAHTIADVGSKAEKDSSNEYQFMAQGMTKQDHVKARTGSKRHLTLDPNVIALAFEGIIHDLAMRSPIRDVLKILNHPQVAEDIINVVGRPHYKMMVDTTVDAARALNIDKLAGYGENNNFVMKIINGVLGKHATAVLVGNAISTQVQILSLPMAISKMGGTGIKHVSRTLDIMIENWDHFNLFRDFAAEVSPAIKDQINGVDEYTLGSIAKLLPTRRLNTSLDPLIRAFELINAGGFGLFAFVDGIQKVIVSVAGYSQFMAGEAPGWSMDKVMALEPAKRVAQGKAYASSLVRLTLTSGDMIDRAAAQKLPVMRISSVYWNDGRNTLNNLVSLGRRVVHESSHVVDAITGGGGSGAPPDEPPTPGTEGGSDQGNGPDYKKAKEHSIKAVKHALHLLLLVTTVKLLEATLRGHSTPFNDAQDDMKTPEGRARMGQKFVDYMYQSPLHALELTTSNIPEIRNITFAMNNLYNKHDFKQVSDVKNTVETQIATGLSALIDLVSMQNKARNMSDTQIKALITSTGYAMPVGIPTGAILKIRKQLQESKFIDGLGEKLSEQIRLYGEHQDDKDFDHEYYAQLKEIEAQVNPQAPEATPIPEGTLDTIKKIESNGDWSAKNPNSSASGLYQFTEKTWFDIMEQAPELDLTENGRVSSNTAQQERAMKWFTKHNIAELQAEGLPIDTESIYAAHFLGVDVAKKVLTANDNKPLKTLVGEGAMNANKFEPKMKVKEFKSWIRKKVASVEKG